MEAGDIYVSFGKNETGLYAGDALLVMREAHHIQREALFYVLKMNTGEFKTLLQIALKMDGAGFRDQREALQMAISNNTVRGYSMRSLEAYIGIKREQNEGQAVSYGNKR